MKGIFLLLRWIRLYFGRIWEYQKSFRNYPTFSNGQIYGGNFANFVAFSEYMNFTKEDRFNRFPCFFLSFYWIGCFHTELITWVSITVTADNFFWRATKSVQWLFEICPCDITYSTKLVFSQAYILAEVFAFENVSVQHHGEKVLISSGSAKLQTLKHECSDLKPYIFFLLPQVPDS